MPIRYQLLSPWPEQALAFTTAVERAARLIARARRCLAAHYDLTTPGWRMLRLVAQSDDCATLSQLARRLHISLSSTRETADRLCRASHVSLRLSPADARIRQLVLSELGAEYLSELDAAIQALLLEMTNDVPREELESAARILDRISRRLRGCETVFRHPRR